MIEGSYSLVLKHEVSEPLNGNTKIYLCKRRKSSENSLGKYWGNKCIYSHGSIVFESLQPLGTVT